MNIEAGVEKVRICPAKKAKAEVPVTTYNPLSEYPSVVYEVPEGADVECDPNCPGAELVRRKLGPIPLPIFKDVCPMPEEAPAPDPSDGRNLAVLQ